MLRKFSKLIFGLAILSIPIFFLNSVEIEKPTKTDKSKISYVPERKKPAKQKSKKESFSAEEQILKLEKTIEIKKSELASLETKLEKLKSQKPKKARMGKGKVFYDLGSGVGKVTVHAYLYDSKDPEKSKKFLEENAQELRGDIPEEERAYVSKEKKGSPVYGEIKLNSFEKVLNELEIPYFSKSVGVELSPTRYHHSVSLQNKLKDQGLEEKGKILEFKNENILDTDLSDADYIYMCSTCYPDELMEGLVKKFSKLKNGLIVISLKSMPNYEDYGFELTKELSLPMTWSEGSPVHIYKLNKSKVRTTKKAQEQETKDEESEKMISKKRAALQHKEDVD